MRLLRDKSKSAAYVAVIFLGACSWFVVFGIQARWQYWQQSRAAQKEVDRIRVALEQARVPIAELSVRHGKQPYIFLRLQNKDVRDISALSNAQFGILILQDTAVTNLAPLKTCSIGELSLQGSAVSDISPLEGSHLRSLDLRGCPITNFVPLAKVRIDWWLTLSSTQIVQNLAVLRNLKLQVSEGGNESYLIGGRAWSNKYERVKESPKQVEQ